MGPKKEAPPPEPPAELDPAVAAQQLEERRLFERGEMIARQRVEAMEHIGWKCVQNEKEKRLDPVSWAEKTAFKGPFFVFVKTLTGNRAVPQMNLKVNLPKSSSCTLRELKEAIHAEVERQTTNPASGSWYAPDNQQLSLQGGKIPNDDEYNVSIKSLGITHGSTLHLALLHVPVKELLPAVMHSPSGHSPTALKKMPVH